MESLSSSHFRVGGLVSGLDTDDIVTKLMEIEQKPLLRLQAKKADVTNELTAWRGLNTRIQALSVNTALLEKESSFQVRNVTSSDTDILTVSASAGINTSSYMVTVKALAQSHQISSQSYSSSDDEIGTGTVTITVGSATFEAITIDEDNNTLAELRDSINNGSYGVTAGIVQAGDEDYRLILTSNTEGEDGGISVQNNLSGGTEPTYSTIQDAQDAHVVLGSGENAINIYKSSNVISDIIDGVTLSLKSAAPDNSVTITLSSSTSQIKSVISNFIDQFNNLVDYFDEQFAYDSETEETGTLFSNTSLMQVKYDLYSAATNLIGGSGDYHSLRDIGIGVDKTGKLVIKEDEVLSDALQSNLDQVLNMFTNSEYGLGVRIDGYITGITDPVTGVLKTTEEYFSSEIEALGESIDIKTEYLTRLETEYYEKFSNLEATLAKLQSQSKYLEYQIAAMKNNSSSSS